MTAGQVGSSLLEGQGGRPVTAVQKPMRGAWLEGGKRWRTQEPWASGRARPSLRGLRQGAGSRAAGTKDKNQSRDASGGGAGSQLAFTLWILCVFPDSSHFPWHGRSLVLESGKQTQWAG